MATNCSSYLKRGMLALMACFPMASHGVGVLVVNARIAPERISLGDKAALSIESRDGFQRPLSGVVVKIMADTGYFESNHRNAVQGATNEQGVFTALWHSDTRTAIGQQEFTIMASKNGYIGRYPITAKVIIEGQFERKFGSERDGEGPVESQRPYLQFPGPLR